MDSKLITLPATVQSASIRSHRKQVAWQIIAPIIITIFLFIALDVVITISTFRNYEFGTHFSSISLIWLLMPALFGGIVLLVFSVGFIYGMGKLISILPRYTYKVQIMAVFCSKKILSYNDIILAPFINIRTWTAGVLVLIKHINIYNHKSK